MPTIADLNVLLTLDARQLERGLGDAQRSLRGFGGRLAGIGTGLTAAITAPVAAIGVAVVKSAAEMERLKLALVSVAGSSEGAEKQFARLKKVAKLPGLGFRQAIEGSVRLQAVGLNAKQSEAALAAFGNAIATAGGGAAELDRVSVALTQIVSKGKVSAEEINQIAEAVPQVRAAMEEAFGTANTEEIQKLGLTTEKFVAGLVEELGKLPPVTGGTANAIENFRDTLFRAGAALGKVLLPVITPMIESLSRLLVKFQEFSPGAQTAIVAVAGLAAAVGPLLVGLGALVAAATSLGPALVAVAALLTGPLGLSIAAVTAAVSAGIIVWQRWGDDIKRILSATAEAIVGAFTAIRKAGRALAANVTEYLGGRLRAAFTAVIGSVLIAVDAFTAARDQILGIVQAIVAGVRDWLGSPLNAAIAAPRRAIDGLIAEFQRAKNIIVGNSIVPDMVDAIGREFGRLDQVMVRPAEAASGAVQRALAGINVPSFEVPKVVGTGSAAAPRPEPPRDIQGIWDRLGAAVEGAGGSLEVFGGGLIKVLDDTANGFGGFLDNLKGQLRTTFSQIGSSIGGAVGGGIGGLLGGLLGGVVDWVGGLFDDDDEPQKHLQTWVTVLEEATGAVRHERAEIERTTKAIAYLKKNLDRVSGETRDVWKEAIGRLEEDLAGLAGTIESLNEELRNVPEGFKVALATFRATVPGLGAPAVPDLAAATGGPTATLAGFRTHGGFQIEQVNITTSGSESGEDVLRKIERAAQAREARGGGGVQLSRPVVR